MIKRYLNVLKNNGSNQPHHQNVLSRGAFEITRGAINIFLFFLLRTYYILVAQNKITRASLLVTCLNTTCLKNLEKIDKLMNNIILLLARVLL